MMETPAKRRSDLGVRTLSGVVMMSIAIAAIWQGGWAFAILAIGSGAGVVWEWTKLSNAFSESQQNRAIWMVAAIAYVGIAVFALLTLAGVIPSHTEVGVFPAVALIAAVVGTDIGAYFAGRAIGGPKIAPRISPSKTWSGLCGGIAGASAMILLTTSEQFYEFWTGIDAQFGAGNVWKGIVAGAIVAVTAQAGDFFESWMKRRAGVKDSGNLIPVHGGVFDRTDGLLAVSFLAGILILTGAT
jgi:phosphatidate cytidylyltransferase